jgi:photosystem II stability/assembly factor-like uncharacterized protein
MKKTILGSIVVAAGLVAALFLILGGGPPGPATARAAPDQIVTPTVLAVEPRQAPNNLDTTLVITGADFEAVVSGTTVVTPPAVSLGEAPLADVAWLSPTLLTATVPWGEDPGPYPLTVANPQGGVATLTDAFTVERAIGVWTTGGPYGGQILDLAVSPATSKTAFAIVRGVGLFRTRDGGAWWELALGDRGAGSVAYGPADQLYYAGDSLRRSGNEGEDWEVLLPWSVPAVAPDPHDAQRLWIADGNGVSLLTILPDGSVEQERRGNGLPQDNGFRVLAVDPVSPTILYAGMWDGRLYKTTDAGQQWVEASDGLGPPDFTHPAQALAIHPHDPQILLYSRSHTAEAGYRSDDRGETWTVVNFEAEAGEGMTDLAFSPHVSGTVYASLMGESLVAFSTDAGKTWSRLGVREGDYAISLGLDPASGLPAYLGGAASGTYRSADAGHTWSRATQGITGLPVEDIAAAPSRPETAYVACEHAGAFASETVGQSWRQLGLDFPAAFALSVDPVDPDVAYVGSVRGVYRLADDGTWDHVPLPVSYHTHVEALAVSPISSSLVYGAGREAHAAETNPLGLVARSEDGGRSWTLLDVGEPISQVRDIAIALRPTETVYIATPGEVGRDTLEGPGMGVFRSEDRGASWTKVLSRPVRALETHPTDGETTYAALAVTSTVERAVLKSEDGGDSWAPVPLELEWGGAADFAIDPLAPDTVYAGTDTGLYRSADGGATWTRASGSFGYVTIRKLAIAASDGRTILYVGTTGGVAASGGSAGRIPALQHTDDAYVQPGVYQLTIDHRPPVGTVYLPLLFRGG